jgi:heme/copper-type cytochrome/quinol oxidase subunit 3
VSTTTEAAADPVQEPAAVEAGAPPGPPPPAPGRPGQLVAAAYVVSAAGAMLLTGLLAAYFRFRRETPDADWPPDGVDIPNVALLTLTLGLLMSAATAAWMVQAARRGDRTNLLVAAGITILLGLAHANGMSFVFSAMELGAGDSAYATIFYAVTGTHMALLGAGIVGLLAVTFHAVGGRFTSGDEEPVVATLILWEFVVVAWAAVYACVFLVQ